MSVCICQDLGKRGVEFKGVALMTVSVVLESTLPSFRLSYKIQDKEATVTVLAVVAVQLPPLNSTP